MPRDYLWPLLGLRWFLAHPGLWWRPLSVHAVALAALLLVAVGVSFACWPGDMAWWWYLARASLALGLGAVAALATWALLVPLLLMPMLDSLAVAVRRECGLPIADVPILPAMAAGVVVLRRTLRLRLAMLGLGLVAAFLGPFGPLLGSYALGRLAVVDAHDVALAVGGWDSRQRLAFYAEDPWFWRGSALSAGLLHLLLVFTLVGWLLWLPALVCGAALRLSSRETT
jgi:hypothetical protein